MCARLLTIHTLRQSAPRHLLFAYGANMNSRQLTQRCASPERVSAAYLPDYRMEFYGHSEEWDGALETAIETPGQALWGVLYALNDMDWEQLDLWQDARFDGAGAYFHYPVTVFDPRGAAHEARLFKKDVLDSPLPPSAEYMSHILRGAIQNQLPQPYIDRLRGLDSKPARYPVPSRSGANPARSAGKGCLSCASAG